MIVNFDDQRITAFNQFIEQADSVAIFVHQNPDGDALGSASCMCKVLEKLGKKVSVIAPNECPSYLSFLYGVDRFYNFETQEPEVVQVIERADSFVFLDFNRIDRIGSLQNKVTVDPNNALMIDHHPEPDECARIIFSETSVSSTAELLFHILKASSYSAVLDAEIADSLLTGIITDTGNFSHNCSSPDTYNAVSYLLNLGGDKEKIHSLIFQSNSLQKLQLLGKCIGESMQVFTDYGAALMTISLKDKSELNISSGDSEGIVNYPLSVKGIGFSALFTENEDIIKVSLRSKGSFPANKFSERFFNGGGHLNAAGGRVKATLQQAVDIFVSGLKEFETELKMQVK